MFSFLFKTTYIINCLYSWSFLALKELLNSSEPFCGVVTHVLGELELGKP